MALAARCQTLGRGRPPSFGDVEKLVCLLKRLKQPELHCFHFHYPTTQVFYSFRWCLSQTSLDVFELRIACGVEITAWTRAQKDMDLTSTHRTLKRQASFKALGKEGAYLHGIPWYTMFMACL